MVISRRNRSWDGLVKAAVACLFVVALLALYYRGQAKARWRVVQGSIQEERIAPAHAIETKAGSQMIWEAEYRVDYFVDGHEYSAWADSGVRGGSEAEVRLRVGKVSSCRILYDPAQPEKSVATCQ